MRINPSIAWRKGRQALRWHASRVISTPGEQAFMRAQLPRIHHTSREQRRPDIATPSGGSCHGTSALHSPNDEGYRSTRHLSLRAVGGSKAAMKKMVAFRDQLQGWMVRGA